MPGPEEGFAGWHELRRARAKRLGGAYVEDWVLGANDGVVTTVAVVAGAQGGALGAIAVLVLGFANLFADSFSMGVSNYLGRRSRSEYLQTEKEALEWEIRHEPDEKLEELEQSIAEIGVPDQYREYVVRGLTSRTATWLRALLAFGLGLGDDEGRPWKHGLFTLVAFMIAGLFPLLPYVLIGSEDAFLFSAVAACIALFTAGALRTLITGINWLRSGFEMLGIGVLAALLAYAAGLAASTVIARP